MKKTVIADHHPMTRRGIKALLDESKKFKVVGEVKDGMELLLFLEKKKPTLLILELDIPGISGFAIIRRILSIHPDLKIVIFSSHPENIYGWRCIQSGAKGFIPKTTSAETFLNALKTIASGGTYLSEDRRPSARQIGDDSIEASYNKLSMREIEVLDLLAAGKRNKDIALLLEINEKTVSTYKSRLLKKLKIKNLAELISHSKALPIKNKL